MPHRIPQHLVGNIHRRLHEDTFTEFGISVNRESNEINILDFELLESIIASKSAL
jgi:hypothetical protein